MFRTRYDTPTSTEEAAVPPYRVEVITAGDCAVLRVAGEVDVYTSPDLRQRLIELVEGGTRHLVADLAEVDFLDSSGLGVLVGGLKRLRTQQGSLEIVARGGQIVQLFEMTGLSRAFSIRPSVLAAITADGHWDAVLASAGASAGDWCRQHGLS
jgi:anti-sigma B factor antagonist